ncbi:MAG TPA: sialidase family protein [Acidimicrobiales bacterium]
MAFNGGSGRWPVRFGAGVGICLLAGTGVFAVTPRLGGVSAQSVPPLPRLPVVGGLGSGGAAPRAGVPGSHVLKMAYSTVVQLAYRGIDLGGLNDEAGIGDAFPGTGVPKLPAGFAPNVIVNQDRSATPHNETSVAINPKDPRNILVGENDYEIGFGTSGAQASFDRGRHFYSAVIPFPTVYFTPPITACPYVCRALDALDGGGDPSVVFDRDGIAYYADVNFRRPGQGCISGVFVSRSANGGQTWSRPLFGAANPGDTRKSGDGIVAVNPNDHDCGIFYDKEMMTAGPRPHGVSVDPTADPKHLSRDRLYVTFSEFGQVPPIAIEPYVPVVATESPTFLSYSDDQGRHWSTPSYIGGQDPTLCGSAIGHLPGPIGPNYCVDSQGSDPAVDPATGDLYVTFFNGDNANCSVGQDLVVRSKDGGQTFTNPTQASCLTQDLPKASSTVCPNQTATEQLISGYCFRVPLDSQQSIALNPNDGSVHVTYADNSNGGTDWDPKSPNRTDVDVFTTASHDGGKTWAKAVRVNQDPLKNKRDQFFPWSTYGADGTFYVSFLDRALDTKTNGQKIGESLAMSKDDGKSFKQVPLSTGVFDGNLSFRDGLFMGDYTGVAAANEGAFAAWPDTRRSGQPVPSGNPLNFWSDIAGAWFSDR